MHFCEEGKESRKKRVGKKRTSQNWLQKLTLVAIRGLKVVFMHYKTNGKRVSNKQYGLEEKDLNEPPICGCFFMKYLYFDLSLYNRYVD